MIIRQEAGYGINNADAQYRRVKMTVEADGGLALSPDMDTCVNFKCSKDGLRITRNGMISKLAGTAPRSLWTNRAQTIGLFVDGTSLKLLNSDYTATVLGTVTYGRRMTYIEHPGPSQSYMILMGNGAEMKKYKDGTLSAWGATVTGTADFQKARRFQGPPLSNILLSYYDRVLVADERFALYSESLWPERFRRANNIPHEEPITAMSEDGAYVYIHGFNCTTVLAGRGPLEWAKTVIPMGAIKHGSINVNGVPLVMTRYGWASCHDGIMEPLDRDNFRLDLATTAEAYMGYNPITEEVTCSVLT